MLSYNLIDLTFDRYDVSTLIGQGGIGTVYKAHDKRLDRTIALKIMPEAVANDAMYFEQFRQEARAAARLTHPNVVTVYDVGEEGGHPYIAMEYVEGKTLKEILYERPIPLTAGEILPIMTQVCQALDLAHKNRIIHRDIKTDNIMVTPDGTVKVLDFGIARIGDLEETLAAGGEIKGTVEYMSPEQALGDVLDCRTDIYSLGVVFYEMLTRALPFTGESIYTIITQHINDIPVYPLDMNVEADAYLAQITMKAMAKDREDRYQSVEAILEALDQFQHMSSDVVDIPASFKATGKDFSCDLVGRETEMQILQAAFERANTCQGGTIFLAGEAGVGKTRLAAELQAYAHQRGAWRLTGSSYYRDAHTPYFPFLEALRTFFHHAPPREQERITTFIEKSVPELRVMMPYISPKLNHMDRVENDTDMALLRDINTDRNNLFYAISQVLQEIARLKPLILLLDDFHWADNASQQLLHYLTMEVQNQPILIVVTYRQEDLETNDRTTVHPLTEVIRRMSREGLYENIDVVRLDPSQITTMLEHVLKRSSLSTELRDMIVHGTEGNPFFIQETLKWLRDEGILTERHGTWHLSGQIDHVDTPAGIYDVLVRRLDRLDEDQRELLQVAAVEGELFSPDILAQIMDLNKIKLLRMLHRLEKDHQLVSPIAGKYRFDHTRLRDLLYEELPPELRQEYHRMVAACLEKDLREKPDAIISALATHLYLGGDLSKSVLYLIHAGADAERLFALDEASRHYEWALDAIEQSQAPKDRDWGDLMLRTGRVWYRLGNWQQAQKRFEAILAPAHTEWIDPKIKGEALFQLGRIKSRQGEWDDAMSLYDQSLSIFQKADHTYGTALVYLNYGDVRFEQSDWEQATRYYRHALDIAEEKDHAGLLADIHTSLGAISSTKGDLETAVTHYTASIRQYKAVRNQYGLAKVYNNLGMTYEDHLDWEQAMTHYSMAQDICQKIGSNNLLMLVYLNTAKLAVTLEDLEKAEDLCQRALDLLTVAGNKLGIAEAYKIYGMIYSVRNVWEKAEFYLQQSKALFEVHGNPLGVGEVCREIGMMFSRRQKKEQAIHALEEARSIFEQIHAQGDMDDIDRKLTTLHTRL